MKPNSSHTYNLAMYQLWHILQTFLPAAKSCLSKAKAYIHASFNSLFLDFFFASHYGLILWFCSRWLHVHGLVLSDVTVSSRSLALLFSVPFMVLLSVWISGFGFLVYIHGPIICGLAVWSCSLMLATHVSHLWLGICGPYSLPSFRGSCCAVPYGLLFFF